MSFKIVLPSNIDTSKLSYGSVRDLGGSGAKTVSIRYGSDNLTIQTPVMSIPYDVNRFEDNKKDKDGKEIITHKYDINVSFRGMEENTQIRTLHDKLLAIEQQVLEDAWKNVSSWFKGREDEFDGPRSMRIVFNPMVKKGLDKVTKEVKYPSTMKIKIPYDTEKGEFKFAAYSADQERIDFHSVKDMLKGGKGRLLIQLTGLWFVGKNFGCLWKLVQGQFWPVDNNAPSVFSFIDDGEAVGDVASEKHDSDLEEVALSKNKIADSDDEDEEEEGGEDPDAEEEEGGEDPDAEEEAEPEVEEEEEEEPEPVPEPEPVKKAPAKKAATTTKAAAKK